MQNTLLLYKDELKWFDTIKTAQEFAETLKDPDEFAIYTLYMRGARSSITWEINAAPVANLIDNKKAAVKGARAGAWTDLETKTLMASRKKGITLRKIAIKLGRSYNSCYMKTQQQKRIAQKAA